MYRFPTCRHGWHAAGAVSLIAALAGSPVAHADTPPALDGAAAVHGSASDAAPVPSTTVPSDADATSQPAPKLSLSPFNASAKLDSGKPAGPDFSSMSIDDLMNIQVVSSGRHKQRVSEVPAAISVITQEDIARTHYQSIAELLRLVPGVNVQQISPGSWEVGVRGMAGIFTNNLLVMMDGRSVYSAADSGVFWDSVDYVLPDIERIEVVRGPGATLWGANAVNGVINIITKDASETQGLLVDNYAGTDGYINSVRYGGKIDGLGYFRVYAKERSMDDFDRAAGVSAQDGWDQQRAGFRADLQLTPADKLTLTGDYFENRRGATMNHNISTPPYILSVTQSNNSDGGNFLGHWTHTFSPNSEFNAQLYYDYLANEPRALAGHNEEVDVVDLDLQHRFVVGPHEIVWGGEYRYSAIHETDVPDSIIWAKHNGGMQIASGFIQDDITLVPDRFHVIAGTKLEFDSIVSRTIELQPSLRLLWTPDDRNTLWASVSRAARSPSYVDKYVSHTMPNSPDPQSAYTNSVSSSHLMAYEAGYRVQPTKTLSLDISGFFNAYPDDKAQSFGVEPAATWNISDQLALSGSYSYLNLKRFGGSGTAPMGYSDPENQVKLQVHYAATKNLSLDTQLYWIDRQAGGYTPGIPAYFKWDAALTWKVHKDVNITVGVRNILDNAHAEYSSGFNANEEVPRTFFLQLETRF